jgi:hypothetical protein
MVNELINTFKSTLKFMEKSVADLTEDEMVEQLKGILVHAMWTFGHIILSCQGIAMELGVEPWLPDEWESDYGYGSKPHTDRLNYPNKSELLLHLTESKNRLCEAMLNMDASVLAKKLPDETLPTMGHLLFQVVVAHTAYHAGQLAVWRRAMGKQSVGVFV